MPEKLRTKRNGFPVWRNPQRLTESVHYLGEFLPPAGCDVLTSNDFRDLGFGPGSYTVGASPDEPCSGRLEKWITVLVSE